VTATKDYYGILGVLPDVEAEVIRAVYLALAKKYHPDRGGGKAGEEQMKEINEAYEVLIDPAKRKQYDSEYFKSKNDTGDYAPDVDDEDLNTDDFQDDWNFAVEYCPELKKYLRELSEISPTLSVVYQSTILSTKNFDRAEKIKQELLKDFLNRYFGGNTHIQQFAVSLLRNKEMSAAKELNKVVKKLGSNVDHKGIITRINQKFNLHEKHPSNRVFVEEYRGFNIFKLKSEYFVPDSIAEDPNQGYRQLYEAKLRIDYNIVITKIKQKFNLNEGPSSKNSKGHKTKSSKRVFIENYKGFDIFKINSDFFIPSLGHDLNQNYDSLHTAKIVIDEELKGGGNNFFLSDKFFSMVLMATVLFFIFSIIYNEHFS
jgi:curved DNA-binding protein CbpA